MDNLIRHELPQAIAESSEEFVSLHREMAHLADLQPAKFANGGVFDKEEGIKPSKRLKQQIQHEVAAWTSGLAQKGNVYIIKEAIRANIDLINGMPQQVVQPAREMMPNVFYVNGDKDHNRKIGVHTGLLQQIGWLAFSRVQKTK